MRAIVPALIAVLCVAACSDIWGIEDLPPLAQSSVVGSDSGVDRLAPPVDAATEARPEPPACDSNKPFGSPTYVLGLEPRGVNGWPWLTPDEKTIYFSSKRSPENFHIFRGRREDRSAAFENVNKVDGINGDTMDLAPTLTDDQLKIFFIRLSGSYDIHTSSRASTSAAFGPPTPVSILNSPGGEYLPFLRPDGQLWFSSARDGSDAGIDLYVANPTGETLGPPSLVTELNSPYADSGVVLDADGTTIYFASARPGPGTRGGQDIWTAHRETVNAKFGEATPVEGVNTADTDYPGWLSPDGCRLYYTSAQDIFVAERPP